MNEDELKVQLLESEGFHKTIKSFAIDLGLDINNHNVISLITDYMCQSYIIGYKTALENIRESFNKMPGKLDDTRLKILTDEILQELKNNE